MKVNTIVRCTSIHECWNQDGKKEVHFDCVLNCGTVPNIAVVSEDERFYPGRHYKLAVEFTDCPPEEVPPPEVDEAVDLSKV